MFCNKICNKTEFYKIQLVDYKKDNYSTCSPSITTRKRQL